MFTEIGKIEKQHFQIKEILLRFFHIDSKLELEVWSKLH